MILETIFRPSIVTVKKRDQFTASIFYTIVPCPGQSYISLPDTCNFMKRFRNGQRFISRSPIHNYDLIIFITLLIDACERFMDILLRVERRHYYTDQRLMHTLPKFIFFVMI